MRKIQLLLGTILLVLASMVLAQWSTLLPLDSKAFALVMWLIIFCCIAAAVMLVDLLTPEHNRRAKRE